MANINETIFQSFQWYTPNDGSFWTWLGHEAAALKEAGFTYVWLPPASKCLGGAKDSGYAVYDLYDLGEFDQKGSVRTKYGTKEEYIQCIQQLQKHGIKAIVDIILNHRLGGDEKEHVKLQMVPNPEDRTDYSGAIIEKDVFSKFTFPGRQGKYSTFVWDSKCFSGINDDAYPESKDHFFRIVNENEDQWDEVPAKELGNYDYLIGADVNFRNPAVRQELKDWVTWYYETVKFDGIRLDAARHMNVEYINEWLSHVKRIADKDQLFIGEYWVKDNVQELLRYIESTKGQLQLIDAPLHENFFQASSTDACYDMRLILQDTLVQQKPTLAITMVDSHDTQPFQTLESFVEPWFQPLAYAITLLREQGIPIVFYPSIYGIQYEDKDKDGNLQKVVLEPTKFIHTLLKVRQQQAFGFQREYFDHMNLVGWTREGTDERINSGVAVLLSNGDEGTKHMEIGQRHSGKTFIDILGNRPEEVHIDENGWGNFHVKSRSISVWVLRI